MLIIFLTKINHFLHFIHLIIIKVVEHIFITDIGYQLVEWNVLSQNEQKQTFYYKKREVRVFLFFRDANDFEKMDKNTFTKEKK